MCEEAWCAQTQSWQMPLPLLAYTKGDRPKEKGALMPLCTVADGRVNVVCPWQCADRDVLSTNQGHGILWFQALQEHMRALTCVEGQAAALDGDHALARLVRVAAVHLLHHLVCDAWTAYVETHDCKGHVTQWLQTTAPR